MNTRFGRKLQLRLDRFELLRAGVERTRGGRQEKAPLAISARRPAVRLVRNLFSIANAVHDLPIRLAQIQLAAFSGQSKACVQRGRQKTQRGLQTHVSAAPAGVQARDGQHIVALAQQLHMGREIKSIRRAGLASGRGHAVHVQLVPGCVRCRDTGAIQVGHKAVIKIHLQHERLRHRQFLQLELVS